MEIWSVLDNFIYGGEIDGIVFLGDNYTFDGF